MEETLGKFVVMFNLINTETHYEDWRVIHRKIMDEGFNQKFGVYFSSEHMTQVDCVLAIQRAMNNIGAVKNNVCDIAMIRNEEITDLKRLIQ